MPSAAPRRFIFLETSKKTLATATGSASATAPTFQVPSVTTALSQPEPPHRAQISDAPSRCICMATARVRYTRLAPEYLRTAVSRLEGLPSGKPADDSAQASAQEPNESIGVLRK